MRTKITLSVEQDIIKEAKKRAIDLNTDMSSVVEGLLKEFLGIEKNNS